MNIGNLIDEIEDSILTSDLKALLIMEVVNIVTSQLEREE
jgi:hypothetical protein